MRFRLAAAVAALTLLALPAFVSAAPLPTGGNGVYQDFDGTAAFTFHWDGSCGSNIPVSAERVWVLSGVDVTTDFHVDVACTATPLGTVLQMTSSDESVTFVGFAGQGVTTLHGQIYDGVASVLITS